MRAKSVTTLCFRPFHLEQALDGAAAAGFNYVEICAIAGWTEHVDPDNISAASIRRVTRALTSDGLSAMSIAGHGDMVSRDGLHRHFRLLELASEIGARYLNSFAGSNKSASERAELVRSAREIGDRAMDLDLEFCLENDSTEVGTGEEASRLVSEIGHERVGVVYDAANAVFFGGVDPSSDLPTVAPFVRQVHIKDKRGGRGVTDFPPLGEGELDWSRLLRLLGACGYEGPRCLEIEFDGTWPTFEECLAAVVRSREHWEQIESTGT
jgi:L-ribulose-5-phosphate 3-epimerase